MKPNELILRCYAERKDDQWQAFCLDLCLAAQADTFEEAQLKLSMMIRDYIEEALVGEDKAYADQLLSRKAPLFFWIKYFWLRFRIFHREVARLFTLPVPLAPLPHSPI